MSVRSDRIGTQAFVAMVVLLVGGFVVIAVEMMRKATDPGWQDTDGYLSHTIYLAEHGGLLGFLRDSYSGSYPIVERHPLYMLILLPFASQSADFFWYAKLVNVITGALLLATLVWMVSVRYGRGPALVAGLLYALSDSLATASAYVNHESQFTLACLWTWWALTHPGRSEGDPSPPLSMPTSVARWSAGGLALGIAYLVKSPALLMTVAIIVAGLWHARLRFLLGPRVLVMLATAALVSSPLLVRNLVGFGQLFYEGVNSHVMWLGEWSAAGNAGTVMYYDRFGIKTIEANALPTAEDFLRENTSGQIALRLLEGTWNELTVVARDAVSLPFPSLPGWLRHSWGYGVLALAVAGFWLRRRSWDAALLFFWTGAFLVFFGWNTMFPDFRYLAPLVPVWIAFASHAAWQLMLHVLGERRATLVALTTVGVLAFGVGGATILTGRLSVPQPRMAVSPAYQRLTEWLNAHIQPGDRFLLGPTTEFYGLNWMLTGEGQTIQTPDSSTLATFQEYLEERNVRYVVIHSENMHGTGGRLKDDLGPFFDVTSDGELIERSPVPGWRLVQADPGTPSRYRVYELDAGS